MAKRLDTNRIENVPTELFHSMVVILMIHTLTADGLRVQQAVNGKSTRLHLGLGHARAGVAQ